MAENDYNLEQKEVMWDIITMLAACPTCLMRFSNPRTLKGGSARNIKCAECGTVYFISPIRSMGAYPT